MVNPDKRCINEQNRLIWRDWGDESVVFDRRSGQTLLLDLVAREALKSIETVPCNCVELCAILAAHLETEVDEELEKYIDQFFERLDKLGIIDSAP